MSLTELFFIMFAFQMICVACELWFIFRDKIVRKLREVQQPSPVRVPS